MDELILRSLQGRASAGDAELLAAWRARAPENEARWRELERIWTLTGAALPPRRRPMANATPAPNAAALLGASRHAARSGRAHSRWRERGSAAAAIAALLAVAAAVVVLRLPNPDAAAVALEVVTGTTESASAQLPDGTVVRLGPGSRLTPGVFAGTREVHLEGTAFFAVAHEDRPFVVRTSSGVVRVLGTRFRLHDDGSRLEVAVVEGRVAVSAGAASVEVGAGQAATMPAGGAAPVVRPAEAEEGFEAVGDFFAFQSTPLRAAAAELELRLGASIRFADPALERITVTAWFNDAAFDEVMGVLCRIADVRCTTHEGVTWIQR